MTGTTLKKLRTRKGYTQKRLAKELGYKSYHSILEMEKGRRIIQFRTAELIKSILK